MISPYINNDVRLKFPNLGFCYAIWHGVDIGQVPPRFKKMLRKLEADLRRDTTVSATAFGHMELWKAQATSMGLTQEMDRPAPAWLMNRILNGGQIPKINSVVDVANYVSAKTGLPVGAFDCDALSGDPHLSLGGPGESLTSLGGQEDRVLAGEVVYRDDVGVFSRYPRDAQRTRISDATRTVFLVVDVAEGISIEAGVRAVSLATELYTDVSGIDIASVESIASPRT